ncbi:MAG TPA: hypothetical protein VFA77_04645, partial [Candidatus Eisenbacteria bacterium]|nr:hypothetical protein [Candidatus Eisenbacteria bacterium]
MQTQRRTKWDSALKSCADPVRARHFLSQLRFPKEAKVRQRFSVEQARVLCALLGGSQAMSELLVAHPDWLTALLDADSLKHPRREEGLRREVNSWLEPLLASPDYAAAFARLRQFKQQQMLRIATRDLARLGDVDAITRELSDVADVCLSSVLRLCLAQMTHRLGEPHHLDAQGRWCPTHFCVLGLGKLGGQELNYSSDVDVLFVYSEEGNAFQEPPKSKSLLPHGLTNHQFFKRLAE